MTISDIDDDVFAKNLETERTAKDFPKMYQGYYNAHTIYCEKWSELEADKHAKALSPPEIEALFSENIDNKIMALQQDIETLHAIGEKRIDTKSFDFGGQKYQRDEARTVQETLAKELKQLLDERNRHDTKVAKAFYARALSISSSKADALKTNYHALQEAITLRNTFVEHGREIITTIHYIALNDFFLARDIGTAV